MYTGMRDSHWNEKTDKQARQRRRTTMKTIYKTLMAGGAGLLISASTVAGTYDIFEETGTSTEEKAATYLANTASILQGFCMEIINDVDRQVSNYTASATYAIFDDANTDSAALELKIQNLVKSPGLAKQKDSAGNDRACKTAFTLEVDQNTTTAAASTGAQGMSGVRAYDVHAVGILGTNCTQSILDGAMVILGTEDDTTSSTPGKPYGCSVSIYAPASDKKGQLCKNVEGLMGESVSCLDTYTAGNVL